jgi:hypothetical protein
MLVGRQEWIDRESSAQSAFRKSLTNRAPANFTSFLLMTSEESLNSHSSSGRGDCFILGHLSSIE